MEEGEAPPGDRSIFYSISLHFFTSETLSFQWIFGLFLFCKTREKKGESFGGLGPHQNFFLGLVKTGVIKVKKAHFMGH